MAATDAMTGIVAGYNFRDVNIQWIVNAITPRWNSGGIRRSHEDSPDRTALACGSMEIPFYVGDVGAGAAWISPLRPWSAADGSTITDSFWAESTSLNTATGVGGFNTKKGPLSSSKDLMTVLAPNAFSVRFVPRVSDLNNSGTLKMVYYNKPFSDASADGSITVEPTIPSAEMPNFPYFWEQGIKAGEMRMTRIPHHKDLPMMPCIAESEVVKFRPQNTEGFYILVEGAFPAPTDEISELGVIIIDYCYEFVPISSIRPITPMDTAIPGL